MEERRSHRREGSIKEKRRGKREEERSARGAQRKGNIDESIDEECTGEERKTEERKV